MSEFKVLIVCLIVVLNLLFDRNCIKVRARGARNFVAHYHEIL